MTTRYKTTGERAGVRRRTEAYHQRLRAKGLKPRQIWLSEDEAGVIRELVNHWHQRIGLRSAEFPTLPEIAKAAEAIAPARHQIWFLFDKLLPYDHLNEEYNDASIYDWLYEFGVNDSDPVLRQLSILIDNGILDKEQALELAYRYQTETVLPDFAEQERDEIRQLNKASREAINEPEELKSQ